MRLLDLFCCAGGAAMGYHRAGFDEIVGVDIEPQKRYPFRFVQADALEYVAEHGHEFDAIHASPPCQFYSEATPPEKRAKHPDLIALTRIALRASAKPYVIENVEGARHELDNPVMLCGTMFGLNIWRHRYFESPIFARRLVLLPPCQHTHRPVLITGQGGRRHDGTRSKKHDVFTRRQAIGIDWMVLSELTEAIPPAYTEWIGRHLIEIVQAEPQPADRA